MKTQAQIARYLSDKIDEMNAQRSFAGAQAVMVIFEELISEYDSPAERKAIVHRLEMEEIPVQR